MIQFAMGIHDLGRRLVLTCFFVTFACLSLSAQQTTLVFRPEYQIGAAGDILQLEEREDGEIVRRFAARDDKLPEEFVHKSYSDGKLRRLTWHYESKPESGNYLVEESKSNAVGTWQRIGTYTYRNNLLVNAKFFRRDTLFEERLYQYDDRGRVSEERTFTRPQAVTAQTEESAEIPPDILPVILEFRRPTDDLVEAFMISEGGPDDLIARLQYDEEGRILMEERFAKGRLSYRNVYTYNERGRLTEHVKYDFREIAIKHVNYHYSSDGKPLSVIHKDVKGYVLYGLNYTRETVANLEITTVRNHRGHVSGTIETQRNPDGSVLARTEKFLLGENEMVIEYSDFDELENWLRKEVSTYSESSLKDRTVTTRFIRYGDQ